MSTKTSIVALLFSSCSYASAQTLYTVSAGTLFNPWADASISVSAIGTGTDEGTTYVEVISPTASFIVTTSLPGGKPFSTPETVLIGPFTETFVEDASGWRVSAVEHGAEGDAETCTFSANGRGTCFESLVLGLSTSVGTFSGSVVPFYTLAASMPMTPTSSAPAPTAPNAAVRNSAFPVVGVVFLEVGLLFNLCL